MKNLTLEIKSDVNGNVLSYTAYDRDIGVSCDENIEDINLELDYTGYLSDIDYIFVVRDTNNSKPDFSKVFLDYDSARKDLVRQVSFWYPNLALDLADKADVSLSEIYNRIAKTDRYDADLNMAVIGLPLLHRGRELVTLAEKSERLNELEYNMFILSMKDHWTLRDREQNGKWEREYHNLKKAMGLA